MARCSIWCRAQSIAVTTRSSCSRSRNFPRALKYNPPAARCNCARKKFGLRLLNPPLLSISSTSSCVGKESEPPAVAGGCSLISNSPQLRSTRPLPQAVLTLIESALSTNASLKILGGSNVRKRNFAFAAVLIITATVVQFGQTPDAPRYLTPPKEIVEAFDAPSLPQAILSPSKQVIALTWRRPYPTISELSQPMLRLAGARINPRNNGPQRAAEIYAITLKKIADGSELKVTLPPQTNLSNVRFSPDGSHLSFLNRKDDRIELWVADTANGRAKLLSGTDRLNATMGDPCDWLEDNTTLVCELVPAGRGPAPQEPTVPMGPNIQENNGTAAPAATFEDMLKTAHDEALFEYYFTSQLAAINVASGRKMLIGRPAIFGLISPAPSGEYPLVSRIKRPFSHLIPVNGFPEEV